MKFFIILGSILLTSIISLAFYIWQLEKKQSQISSGPRIDSSINRNNILFIIDLQKDLTTSNGLTPVNISKTALILEKLNKLIPLVTKDKWYICYTQNEYEKDLVFNLLTNNSLMPGSKGAELDDRLLQQPQALVIKKNIRDAFSNPQLDSFLNSKDIGNIYISGIDAKYCVNSTIEAGLKRNYNIFYIDELITTNKIEEFENLKNKWQEQGVKEVKFKDLMEQLERTKPNKR